MSIQLRPFTADEVPAFRSVLAMGFGQDYKPDGDERFLSVMPLAESLVHVLERAGFAPVKLSGYQQSSDEAFHIDDQSSVAHVEHQGQALSLFAEAWALF